MDVTKKVRFNWGIVISLLIIAIPMFGWKLWYPFNELSTTDAFLVSFAKIGAFGGFAMFAISLILSGRYVFYEKLFGGLDKMYIAHRFFGTMSVILLAIHPLALSIISADTVASSLLFWVDVREVSILFGAVALYGLIGLIIWTIFTKSSYETFLRVHRLLGVFFIAGVLHMLLSGGVMKDSQLLNVYMIVLAVAGIVSFFQYTVLGDLLHRPIKYRIVSKKKFNDTVLEIILEPTVKFMRFSPGQFVYINFPDLGNFEYHPFSISSGKNDQKIRIVVKQTGDFTKSLSKLHKNTYAYLKGPYGGFTFFYNTKRKKQLWIAGGIGVTPFLSGARSLPQSTEKGVVEMVYATIEEQPYGLRELEEVEYNNPSFNVTHLHQEKFGFVTLETLHHQFKDLHERDIFLCGPPPMLEAIEKEAEKLNLDKNLRFEAFNY